MWSTSGKTNSSWETRGYDNTTRTLTGQSMFSHYPGALQSVDIRYQSSERRHVPESDRPRLQKRNSVTVMRSPLAKFGMRKMKTARIEFGDSHQQWTWQTEPDHTRNPQLKSRNIISPRL